MGNPFKKDKPSAPAPVVEAVAEAPAKTEVVAAKTQAKETMAGPSRRRRGSLGRMSSLLTAGYRGYGTEDTLG